ERDRMYRHLPRSGGPADPLRGVAFGAGSAAAGSPDTPHVAEKLAARLGALSEEERSVGLLPLLDPRAGRNGGVAARRFCGGCLRSRLRGRCDGFLLGDGGWLDRRRGCGGRLLRLALERLRLLIDRSRRYLRLLSLC